MVNGGSSNFFRDLRGIRQCDPLSPLLFIAVMQTLNKLILQAREVGLLGGLKVGDGETATEIIHLFFADDTLIFYKHEKRVLLNLTCILTCFQIVSCLSINLSKSKLVRLGNGDNTASLARVLGCKVVDLPIKHLRTPLGANYKNVRTHDPVVARV